MDAAVHEGAEPTRDRIARLRTAIEWAFWVDANLRALRRRGSADADRQRGGQYEAADGELMPLSHRVFSLIEASTRTSPGLARVTAAGDQPRRETEPEIRLAQRQPCGE
jgi:hypothetical protein